MLWRGSPGWLATRPAQSGNNELFAALGSDRIHRVSVRGQKLELRVDTKTNTAVIRGLEVPLNGVNVLMIDDVDRPSPSVAGVLWILGELRFGILLLSKGKKRAALERWFDAGVQRLLCLPWESETGLRWAELLARLRTGGKAMPIKDSFIAATALTHDLIVATRNRADFEKAGVRVVDPFAIR